MKETAFGLLLPWLGTTLGAACVFFMRGKMRRTIQRALTGFALAHKKVILEQWSWQKEALRHPASYILEREVSNAWIAIVTEGEPFQERIDEATLASNREIQRKLIEFGYLDRDGNKIKDYNIHLIDELIAEREEGG